MSNYTKSVLPVDANARPIQVLSPDETTVATFALATTSNPTALPTGAEIVEVAVTGNCKFAFGTSGVNATVGNVRILTPGVYTYHVPKGADHFDAVTVGGSTGNISVAKMV